VRPAGFINRVITGKEVVLSGQVRGWLWLLHQDARLCVMPQLSGATVPQVALALFLVGKVGSWFTSLGLLYTGADACAGYAFARKIQRGCLRSLRVYASGVARKNGEQGCWKGQLRIWWHRACVDAKFCGAKAWPVVIRAYASVLREQARAFCATLHVTRFGPGPVRVRPADVQAAVDRRAPDCSVMPAALASGECAARSLAAGVHHPEGL